MDDPSSGIGDGATLGNAVGERASRAFSSHDSGSDHALFLLDVSTATGAGDYFFCKATRTGMDSLLTPGGASLEIIDVLMLIPKSNLVSSRQIKSLSNDPILTSRPKRLANVMLSHAAL